MSLKDLFKNRESFKISPLSSADDVAREIGESSEAIAEFQKDRDRFVPAVDYSDPANFARYGLAEEYYDEAIRRIYQTYPYDGSYREKLEWHNSSSYIDNYVFEREYPRANGHVVFSAGSWGTKQGSILGGYGIPASSDYEYIEIKGGPHANPNAISLKADFSGSNIYDADSNRQSNLEFNLDSGVTVEFWLRKDSFELSSNTEKEVIFDLWNGHNSSSADYGRFRVELDGTRTATVKATATFTFSALPANNDTVTLMDADGNEVVYKFDTSNDHYDGRLHSDGTSVNVGIDTEIGALTGAGRLDAAINNTTDYANGHVLNITSLGPISDSRSVATVDLTQDTAGYTGNTVIAIGSSVITGPLAAGKTHPMSMRFSGGAEKTPFLITAMSGTSGLFQEPVGSDITIASLANWKHYAVSLVNGASEVTSSFYVDGALNHGARYFSNTSLNEVTGNLNAYLGALKTAPSGTGGAFETISAGAGKLSASLDEFRYWKSKRTSENIGRYWFTHVYGGTNTDMDKYDKYNPVDLGVYYKFNEGITATSSVDSTVLDYSGRFSNGSWTGYTSTSRHLGSAIVSASAAKTEFKDPIVYSFHPDVVEYSEQKRLSGSAHDTLNNSALYRMLPRWVIDDDVKNGGNIKRLTQILASYFDTLHLQIQSLSGLKEATYGTYMSASISSSAKPLPFAGRLLENMGLQTPELFIDAEIIEKLSSRDEKRHFEEDLHDIKNLIYHNIYNNLAYIYKSKGTEKSFRNLVRCFGIDDELVKINVYGQNALYQFKDNFKSTVINKKTVDFNDPTRFGATIYQLGHITGSDALLDFPATIESEAIFPRKRELGDPGYFNSAFFTASLFGAHSPGLSDADDANFQVFAVRTGSSPADYDTKDAFFMLTSSDTGRGFPFSAITSSVYTDVYDDTKWNFAVRLIHDKYRQNNTVTGVTGSAGSNRPTYTVEFYGVNTVLGEVIDEFTVSSSVSLALAEGFSTGSQRLYAGAHRTDFTGTLLQNSDVRISSLRYWQNYVDNDTIKAHAKDPTNYGLKNPYQNLSLFHTGANKVFTPSIESLALNWDFETITGSNPDGGFDILDFSSGSALTKERYGNIGTVTKNKHSGRGYGFVASSTSSINRDYFHIAKQQLPESIFSDDMVSVIDEDEHTFTRESRPTQFFFAAEKSMYQTVSEEMINMFATIVDFNNLIGEPVYRYRQDYKDLAKLRQLFFERVGNTPDLDKYVDFYKWIDHSISSIIRQIVPISANFSENLRTIIESHVFERNKHWNKFPRLDQRGSINNLEAVAVPSQVSAERKGKPEGKASPATQRRNTFWWKNRAERSHPLITSGDAAVDKDRDKILSASSPVINSFSKRAPATAVSFGTQFPIHGGANYRPNKDLRYAHIATTEFGPTTIFTASGLSVTASNNFVLVRSTDVEEFLDSVDPLEVFPADLYKKRWKYSAFNNSDVNVPGSYDYNVLKGGMVLPFNLYKHGSVITGGYHHKINTDFKEAVDFTNIHIDTYGPDNEVPMQGPFTEKHVGGLQHRHVDINRYDTNKGTATNLDDQTNRPEDWFIVMGSTIGTAPSLGIIGPTYTTTGDYDKDIPRARLYRGLKVKSPVNIRNIRTTGSTVGNYSSSIEYVSTVGRTENNAYFKENEGVSLPSRYVNDLPMTTNVHTIVGIAASTEGNIFGPSLSNLNNTSNRVASDTQFSLPRRDLTGSDSVIISRFAAPGAPEASSRGYLDIVAEEHSVYNALPFRNLSVRSSGSGESSTIRANIITGVAQDGLRTLLSRHQGRFGIDSQYGSERSADYVTTPSFHKIPRNRLKRLEYSNEQVGKLGTVATASVRDNAWVQHHIPRSDLRYSWLTASFHSYPSLAETYGHAPADGFVSSSVAGVVAAYNFVSASEVSNTNGIVVPFAAHNTYLVDGVVSEQNLLSASNFPDGYISGLAGVSVTPEMVHGITLQRHGPYQWPTWKQIRTSDNQVMRYQRKNNIFSITTPGDQIFTRLESNAVASEQKGGKLNQFTEPSVTSKYKPIVHILQTDNITEPFDAASGDIKVNTIDTGLEYSYANNKGMFPTDKINLLLGLGNEERGFYGDIADLYINNSEETAVNKFTLLSYRETIYPQQENTYLSGSRSRLTWDLITNSEEPSLGAHSNRIWRSRRGDRTEEDGNSQDQDIDSMSTFELDARSNFKTAEISNPGTGSGTGELQNLYTIFHNGENLGSAAGSTKSVKFSRHALLTASQAHSNGPLNQTFFSSSAISLWFKAARPSHNVSSSLVSKGRNDTADSGETMTFDIRLEGNGLRYNIGAVRGNASLEGRDTGMTLSDGNWHHLLFAWYYKSETDRKYQAWVDGNRSAYGSTNMSLNSPTASFGSYVLIGANPPDNSGANMNQEGKPGFRGLIDELTFFTGSLSSSLAKDDEGATLGGFSGSQATTLYNNGRPISVLDADLGSLTILSHYRMGEHGNDGPLAQATGFIQDTSTTGLTVMTGNLSASVADYYDASPHAGFSADGQGIITDAPFKLGGGNTNVHGALYCHPVPEKDPDGRELGYYAGDTLWEVSSQSGKEPAYDSYDDFREQIRGVSKDYTIVPEFRMSNHLFFYLDVHDGNFLADNEDILELEGGTLNMTSSGQEGFYKTYTNTDFLQFFNVLKQEHAELGHNPTRLTLKCNAVVKFFPYQGFYPVERTVQLASLFSKSYGERLNFNDPSATTTVAAFGSQISFRTFLAPLFAPGVLYNSIKSGLAVDHPIMTASYSTTASSLNVAADWTGSYSISSSFDYRVPFEALAEPENYLGGRTIVDYEPHPSASINSTASWDGTGLPLFKLAMNNFIAEVPKFFLKGGAVTSLVSAKDDNKKYFKAEEGMEYRMRVVLRNGRVSRKRQIESNAPRDNTGGQDITRTGSFFTSPTTTMYSRRSAFGPPVHADYIEFYEPFTPPYMDGYAHYEAAFRPLESRYYFIDEIVSQITSSFYRVGEQYFGSGEEPSSIAVKNQMHVSASLNLLEIARTKKTSFDPVTGNPVLVEDDTSAPSVAIIQTKWETPILDFSDVNITLPTFGSGSVSRGMWHQYGNLPSPQNGIFLEIQDLTDEEKINPTTTGSLADLMGFAKIGTKLGQVEGEKVIREAVVAIPFAEKAGKKEFFNIPRGMIDLAISGLTGDEPPSLRPGQSIIDMVNRMRNYNFPPKFDFLTNKTVKPVAMYIFEFEHILTKDDLFDIWQGLSPEIGRNFEMQSSIVSHDFLEGELVGSEMQDSLRWMVFKVKQRAAANYYEMLEDSIKDPGFEFELEKGITKNKNEYDYSYNWPYDWFSLVEMIKLDAEVVIENKSDEE